MLNLYRNLAPYFKYIVGLHEDVETKKELEFLVRIFKKHRVSTVLDVACGIGRHSIPLVTLGYKVTGIDYSKWQLKEARKYAKRQGVRPKFLLKNANSFTFRDKYDAAICMWTTIGEEPLVYKNVIRNIYKALRPGGIFVIDNNDWSYIPKLRDITRKDIHRTHGVRIKRLMRDRFTDHFRVRETTYDINGKKFFDICITYTKKPEEWVKELKEAGFKNCRILRRLARAFIVGEKK